MCSCPVRAGKALEGHGRPLRITLSRASDCTKYEIMLDVALHFDPGGHSCAEKLNKTNDRVGRETRQLFKLGLTEPLRRPLESTQYAAGPYRAVLERHGIQPSMSRRGNCLDNAPMESFFASLKTERVHEARFRTRAEARAAVFEYIEVFYNRQRLHSALGYRTPAEARASMEAITMRKAA